MTAAPHDAELAPIREAYERNDPAGAIRQAMALAGDARATDPVCSKSPLHAGVVARAEEDAAATTTEFVYRRMSKGG